MVRQTRFPTKFSLFLEHVVLPMKCSSQSGCHSNGWRRNNGNKEGSAFSLQLVGKIEVKRISEDDLPWLTRGILLARDNLNQSTGTSKENSIHTFVIYVLSFEYYLALTMPSCCFVEWALYSEMCGFCLDRSIGLTLQSGTLSFAPDQDTLATSSKLLASRPYDVSSETKKINTIIW